MRQKQKTKLKIIEDIDAKFANIQKYVNDLHSLDGKTKENIIILCMICNDNILKQIEENNKCKK